MNTETGFRAVLSRASSTFVQDLLGLASLVATLVVALNLTELV